MLSFTTKRLTRLDAPPLTLEKILHSPSEAESFEKNLIHTILRIIVKHGGDSFKKYEKDVNHTLPATPDKIEVHKTKIYPLPVWPIDESSIQGNADVVKAIIEELGLTELDAARFQSGDQLSISRLRALEAIRAGQEEGVASFFWGIWIAGLFHAKMADIQGVLLTHWGKPNTGARNPGSLWFHNTRLDRLPITTTSLPPFRTCRDLVFISLYARVLHCLLLVSGCSSLEEYAATFDWDSLVHHAELIYHNYANSERVNDLRWEREVEQISNENLERTKEGYVAGDAPKKKPTKGDMVFENALLFMRDALISREFTDAVKAGDSGRVYLVVKTWALSFRGNGRTKYAYEMLHTIHNLEDVWDAIIRKIVFNNWLLNPTGKENSFVETDLLEEHLIYFIKVWFKAHGSNASWDWLAMVGPCVDILRQLARNFNDELGSNQGSRHAPPDLSNDIATLMESLAENHVYEKISGRVLDEDDAPVKDVIQVGLHNLTEGPLDDFNEAFRRLQQRRRRTPVGKIAREWRERKEARAEGGVDEPDIVVECPHQASGPLDAGTSTHPTPSPPHSDPRGDVVIEGSRDDHVPSNSDGEGSEEDEPSVQEPVDVLLAPDEKADDGDELQRLSEADLAFDMDVVPIIDVDELSEESDSDVDDVDEWESDSDGSMYVD